MKLDNTVAAVRDRRRFRARRGHCAPPRRERGVKGRHLRSPGGEGQGGRRRSSAGCSASERHLDESVDAASPRPARRHGQERILINCAGTGNAIKTASRSKEDGAIKHFPLEAFN
jgi:hypothetical protein